MSVSDHTDAIFHSAPRAMLVLDGESGTVVQANPAAGRLYRCAPDDLCGQSIATLHGDGVLAQLHAALALDPPPPLAVDCVAMADLSGHCEIAASRLVPADGGAPRLLLLIEDITDRMRTEEALRASEQRHAWVLGATGDGIWDWDIIQNRVTHNPQWGALLGMADTPDGHPVEAFAERLHEDDRPAVMAAIQETLAGRADYHHQHRMRRTDGRVIWVLDRGRVVQRAADGSPQRMVGSLIEVTERVEAEQKVREAESLLRSAIETIQEGFVIYDPQDRLIYCNERYRELYGRSAAIIEPGRTFEEIIRYGVRQGQYPEAAGDEEAWIAERLRLHRQSNVEAVQQIDDGRWIKVRERLTATGHIVGFRVDVTDLYQAKEAAEAANVAKSRFLATMSHEIRTPLNGVLGMAQLLLMPDLSDAERLDGAQTILDSGQTLLTLLNDILDVSKVEAGKLEIETVPLDAARLIRDSVALMGGSTMARNKPIELTTRWQGPDGECYQADPHRLGQMLTNLLGNAIKFTPRGEVCVIGRELRRDADTAELEFAVQDTGIGIAPDKLAQIFQPFSQSDNSTTRRYGGTGLGLTIVRSLAQLMDGDVGVESTLGKGSRFWFRVRVGLHQTAAVPATAADATAAGAAAALRPAHILVVEDNPTNQRLMQVLLGKLGMQVSTAPDGRACVRQLQAGAIPDLVMMDCEMPVLDGFAATTEIRRWEQEQGRPRLPIIALTADAFDEDRQRCLAVGMDDFLSKPLRIARLKEALQRWLPGA